MLIQIPITNQPNQTFTCVVPFASGNKSLQFFVNWNTIAEYWQMTITDAASNTVLIDSMPLITGQQPAADLLDQFQYLNIGSAYVVPISKSAPDYPGLNDWDNNFILVWTS